MLLKYKNEITILYSGGCRNKYFETKRSGGYDEHIKTNQSTEDKTGLRRLQVLRSSASAHQYRKVPMFLLNRLLKRLSGFSDRITRGMDNFKWD